MKLYVTATILTGMLIVPAAAFANVSVATYTEEAAHLTAIIAALKMQVATLQGKSLACAVVVSKKNVKVGEPFTLAWNSIGAIKQSDPAKAIELSGSISVAADKPGHSTYTFTFYGANGATTTCTDDFFAAQ